MNGQFQNFFVFPNLDTAKNFQLGKLKKIAILKISKVSILIFHKFLILKIPKAYNF